MFLAFAKSMLSIEKRVTEAEVVSRLERQLTSLLPNLKLQRVTREAKIGRSGRADLLVRVKAGNRVKNLLIEVKSIGEPRMAERAISQLRSMGVEMPGSYLVFAAPYISDRAREICRAEGVGYLDLAGDAYLQFGAVLVDRTSPRAWRFEKRGLRSLYAPKATRVVRALLQSYTKPTRITDLARSCSMSLGGVFQVVDLLETKGLISRQDDRKITVDDPKRLLLDWARDWSIQRSEPTRYFSLEKTPERLISRIAEAAQGVDANYALTGMAGASLVAPFVRYEDVWFYISSGRSELVANLELRPVSSGANVTLLQPYDEGVYSGSRVIRGARVVSDVQLFVDLYNDPARGREQAEALLEQVIRFPGAT
jgi:transcriptional regulator with AbiEi antitoxin domain of type IV toxin-antitoxin system